MEVVDEPAPTSITDFGQSCDLSLKPPNYLHSLTVMAVNFFSLPLEIRNMIYAQLFVSWRDVYPFPRIAKGQEPCPIFRVHVNVLLVCQQISWEASAILYGQNTFRFDHEYDPNYGPSRVRRFMEIIGPRSRVLVRHVILRLGHWNEFTSFNDETARCRLKVALAVLSTCFRLKTLTVTFFHQTMTYLFSFVEQDPAITDRRKFLQQVTLNLSATFKAIENCRHSDV